MKMSETVPHVLTNSTDEQHVIQLTPVRGLSAAEAQTFREKRRKEAEHIDPQTCEIMRRPVDWIDIYNIFQSSEWNCMYSYDHFVRNGPDDQWIWEEDLPGHIREALDERIEREADTYANYLKRPKESNQLWQAKRELRTKLSYHVWSLQFDYCRTEVAHRLRAYLHEWRERNPGLLHPRTGDQTIVALFDCVSTMLDIIQPDNKTAEHT
jgi:hypothetical protein